MLEVIRRSGQAKRDKNNCDIASYFARHDHLGIPWNRVYSYTVYRLTLTSQLYCVNPLWIQGKMITIYQWEIVLTALC